MNTDKTKEITSIKSPGSDNIKPIHVIPEHDNQNKEPNLSHQEDNSHQKESKWEDMANYGGDKLQQIAGETEKKYIQQSRDNFLARYKQPDVKQARADNQTLKRLGYNDPSQFVHVTVEHKNVESLPSYARSPYYEAYFHLEDGITVITRAYKNDDKQHSGGEPPIFAETLFNMRHEAAIQKNLEISQLPVNEFIIDNISNDLTLNKLFSQYLRNQPEHTFDSSNIDDLKQVMETPFPKAVKRHLDKYKYTIPGGPKELGPIKIWKRDNQIYSLNMKIDTASTGESH